MPPERRGTILACIALLSTAASPEPPASDVQQVPPEEALAILGHNVEDPDGKDIGRLVDVLVGAEGLPQAAVIDFGGFLGVGSRKIAVRWSALHFAPGDTKHPITLELTPDQIKGAPEFKDVAKPAPVVVAAPVQPAPPPQPAATTEAPGGTEPPATTDGPASTEGATPPQPKQ
jgi:hypothetical protein